MTTENAMDLRSQRGATLVEMMVSVAVLLVAAAGTGSLYVQQLRMNADARRITEAAALARDLVENIATWPYLDARLANAVTANDGDIADDAFAFEGAAPVADHAEADLALGTWTGLPARQGFERYWNVAYPDDIDANGTPDAARIAVIVRWRSAVAWRRVVLLTVKPNPAEAR